MARHVLVGCTDLKKLRTIYELFYCFLCIVVLVGTKQLFKLDTNYTGTASSSSLKWSTSSSRSLSSALDWSKCNAQYTLAHHIAVTFHFNHDGHDRFSLIGQFLPLYLEFGRRFCLKSHYFLTLCHILHTIPHTVLISHIGLFDSEHSLNNNTAVIWKIGCHYFAIRMILNLLCSGLTKSQIRIKWWIVWTVKEHPHLLFSDQWCNVKHLLFKSCMTVMEAQV